MRNYNEQEVEEAMMIYNILLNTKDHRLDRKKYTDLYAHFDESINIQDLVREMGRSTGFRVVSYEGETLFMFPTKLNYSYNYTDYQLAKLMLKIKSHENLRDNSEKLMLAYFVIIVFIKEYFPTGGKPREFYTKGALENDVEKYLREGENINANALIPFREMHKAFEALSGVGTSNRSREGFFDHIIDFLKSQDLLVKFSDVSDQDTLMATDRLKCIVENGIIDEESKERIEYILEGMRNKDHENEH